MICTATQVTLFTSITASVATIISKEMVEIVQERILLITNNYFTSEVVAICDTADFNATNRTIILDGNKWEEFGFKANDDTLIYQSLRNDKVVTISSISDYTATLTSACSVVDESYSSNDGPLIYFFMVQWPIDIQHIACDMIYFDNDVRNKVASNIRSRSLGPLSESYTVDSDKFGYPDSILKKLEKYTLVRLN
jgi:hypothetical protein